MFRRLLLAFPLVVAGCAKTEAPPPDDLPACAPVIWAQPENAGASLSVIGSWNGWALPGVALRAQGDRGWQGARLPVGVGTYGYQIVENGVPRSDATNAQSTFRGDTEVSLLRVADCTMPALAVADARATDGGDVSVTVTLTPANDGAAIPLANVVATIDGAPASVAAPSPTTLAISGAGFVRGKHRVSVTATDAVGRGATTAVSVFVQPKSSTWDSGLLYQIVTDRYRGDGATALAQPDPPGNRAGGTFAGITGAIAAGTFDELGVSALWISPVYVNPTAPQTGPDGRSTEGYHGYWPVDSRAVDPHFGGEAGLHALMDAAHAAGLRVLFDIVPNHVHQDNPLYTQHADWFSHPSPPCYCGVGACDWATHIDGCWFTTFLPDYAYQNEAAAENAADEALFWMNQFDADGVRIDAVPMMPRMASRRVALGLREGRTRGDAFVLGEVFTGPGDDGIAQIRYRIGPDGLDSAFDFPLLWALRDAIAYGDGFAEVEATLAASDTAYAGSGVVLSRILGNHDTTRFVSEIVGDADGDPWTEPPAQPTSAAPYARMKLALAAILTLPGLPTLYYGDEIGLAGAGDPDARRVFPDDSTLLAPQIDLRAATRRLGRLRACDATLARGDRVPLVATGTAWAYARTSGSDAVIVAMSTAGAETLALGSSAPAGAYVDALSGAPFTIDATGALPLPASGLVVLVPAASTCLE